MERLKRWICTLLAVCVILPLLPVTAWGVTTEEFSLTVGDTYYFYLGGTDTRWAYIPFTYAGTINAYVLNENAEEVAKASEYASAATNANANNAKYGYTYDHSLFVSEINVLDAECWGGLTKQSNNLIYGRNYTSNGISYTMRAMTGGSLPRYPDYTYGDPGNNEWDVLCSKGDYIKNATAADTWVQDTFHNDKDQQCLRGGEKLRRWGSSETWFEDKHGYRPVLEIKDVGSLPSSMEREDALKVVTIDLSGGWTSFTKQKTFNIVVKNNSLDFTAPPTYGLTRPDGSWGDGYLMWEDEYGVKYYPGETVRRNVTKLTALWNYEGPEEQFDLTTGETYYFDLSTGISFTGTQNKALPDTSMHYVPFTYVGTVNSYVLNSASAGKSTASAAAAKTTSSTGQYGYTYDHSLFISDYGLYEATWQNLNLSRYNLIFGRNYPANGVNYSLRAPSVGSKSYEPLNNECDAILNKDFGCIKNGDRSYFWGQDTYDRSNSKNQRSKRSGKEGFLRRVSYDAATNENDYRPVLEILNDGTMTRDALRVVTLDLNNASFSGQRYLKMVAGKDCTFTAPSFAGITLPEGSDAKNARWKDDRGRLYAPGDSVPADVSSLRFRRGGSGESPLIEGETYWFDLSAAGYVGEKYDKLPDPTLHYVPFTYTGNINAYALDGYIQEVTEGYAQEHRYDHSLFMADYPICKTSWNALNDAGFLYGKDHTVNGVTYELRAPSALGTDNGDRLGSEWDEVLAKGAYIKNWENNQGTWGQDSLGNNYATCRGYYRHIRSWDKRLKRYSDRNYRPVLEVVDDELAIGATVTLDLNGSRLDGAEWLSIIVNQDAAYTAPTAEGLPRPEGIEGDYFRWLGSDGELYAPGYSVSATVLTLTAQWTEPVSHTHVYGDWTFNNDATHTRTCTVAGCGHSESGSCTGSTPTCTAASICGTCHGELAPEDLNNHTGTPEWTFTETEHQKAYTCCQKITVPSEPHAYADDEALTCSTCGYKRTLPHRHDYDDKWLSDKTHHWQLCSDPDCPSPNEFGNRAEHVYDSDEATVCNTCGYERPAPHTHVFDGPYADKGDGTHSPTCSVKGCSEISPDSSSHTGGDAAKENVIAATCTTGGSYDEVVRCTECAAEISREHVTVDATGHSNGEPTRENVVDATCTTDGRYDEIVRCTKCKAEISNTHKTTSATGHNWDNWTVIKAATATADGEKMRVCAVCSAQETEPIPATGGSEPEKPDKPDDKPNTTPDVTPDKPQPDDTGHSGAVRRYPARTEPDAAAESTDKTIRSGNTGDSGVALYAAAFLAAALGGLLLPKLRRRKTR